MELPFIVCFGYLHGYESRYALDLRRRHVVKLHVHDLQIAGVKRLGYNMG